MMRILGTGFAALLGLAFGSFLNVCLSRWPQSESVVEPRSHCRNCIHTLTWWENIPLLSWLVLRGRCRNCRTVIPLRYPLVEFAVGVLWAIAAWQSLQGFFDPDLSVLALYGQLATLIGQFIFYWLLVALALLDAEHFWLPDRLTLPGTALGLIFALLGAVLGSFSTAHDSVPLAQRAVASALVSSLLNILGAAALILLIRWLYWLLRRREGLGLGDAKLMALLAAWLGLPGALLAFGLGVVLGALIAVVLLVLSASNRADTNPAHPWALKRLPLGTFLCAGGLIASFWGERIIAAYLRWAGF